MAEEINDFDEKTTRGSAAYAVFTMCRAMYATKYGQQASKNYALSWVNKEFPQWTSLLELAGGLGEKDNGRQRKRLIGSELPKVVEFVNFAIDQVSILN